MLREHLAPFAVTLCGLTAALLLGNIIKLAELVIAKGVSLLEILRLLIYLCPYLLSFTMPMAGLIAMVLAFGRLNSDYEMIAMRASGVSPTRLILPVLTTALVLSGGLLLLNNRVVPESHLAFRRQLKAIGIKQPTAYLEAGMFIKEFSPYVLFVYQIEKSKLFHVRIYESVPQGPTRTIVASRGTVAPSSDQQGAHLTLYDGSIDEWDPERPGSLYKVAFRSYVMNLRMNSESSGLQKKMKEMTFAELLREQQRIAVEGIGTTPVQMEVHRRIASSFAIFIFAVFGLALGLGHRHQERLVTFVWILGIFMAYYLASLGMNAIALKEWLPAWQAMWLPNVVGLIIGTGCLVNTLKQ